MSVLLVFLSIAISLVIVVLVDECLLRRGVPSIGLVVTVMYGLTYGIGWCLWRFDPSSLFGYGTASTVGSLDRLGLLFALGLSALASSYCLARVTVGQKVPESIPDLAEQHRPRLQSLSFALVVISVIGVLGMSATGLFLRDPQ